jgi:hypothetical protein
MFRASGYQYIYIYIYIYKTKRIKGLTEFETVITWPCLQSIREDRLRLLTRPNKTHTVNGDHMTMAQ